MKKYKITFISIMSGDERVDILHFNSFEHAKFYAQKSCAKSYEYVESVEEDVDNV